MHVSYASVVLDSCLFCWAGSSTKYTGGVCLPGWTLRRLSFGRHGAVSNLIILWIIHSTIYLLALQTIAVSAYVGWLGCICGFICSAAPCMPMVCKMSYMRSHAAGKLCSIICITNLINVLSSSIIWNMSGSHPCTTVFVSEQDLSIQD